MIERPCFQYILRRIHRPEALGPEALVITGMRRVGKTTLLTFLHDRVPSDNKVLVDLENVARRRMFEAEDYEEIRDGLAALGLDISRRAYVFLDEIQFVPRIPSVVKYLMDHHRMKFVLTGSASFYMKNLFSESLSGRKFLYEMEPLDFGEFLLFKGERLKIPAAGHAIGAAAFRLFDRHYAEYLEFGGFPQIVLTGRATDKRAGLEDIFSSYFQKEIMGLGDFRRNQIVRDLMFLLLGRVGSKLDITKLSSELGVSRPTLMEYVAFLEGTFYLHLVRPYTRGLDTEIRGQPKVYACDTGLAEQLGRPSEGALFENAVYLALRRLGRVQYYQRKSGVEIDFILNRRQAFEAKLTVRPHDVTRLRRLARELKVKRPMVVTRARSTLSGVIPAFGLDVRRSGRGA